MGKTDKMNIKDILPLTAVQEGILFHYRLFPGATEYLKQFYMELTGPLRPERFHNTWMLLTNAHDVLRTQFRWEDLSRPVQVILKHYDPDLRETDLSDAPEADRASRAAAVRAYDLKEGFDLEQPPFRVSLIRLEDERWGVLISFHRILFDDWSTCLLAGDFFSTYRALSRGETPLIPYRNGFKDFVATVNTRDVSDAGQFWKKYLKNVNEPSSLGGGPGKAAASSDSGKCIAPLPKELTTKLIHFTHSHNITEPAVFYTTWGLLLQFHIHKRDVLFGVAETGRDANVTGIEHMMGLFINTLPVRVEAHETDTAYDVLLRVQRHLLERANYQHTPLTEILAAWSGVGADKAAGAPVSGWFDTLMVLENYPLDRQAIMSGEPIKSVCFDTMEHTDYHLSLKIVTGESPEIHALYNPHFLEKHDVQQLLDRYIALLTEISTNPKVNINVLGVNSGNSLK